MLVQLLRTRSKRAAGANYQIPQTVRPERRQALAFRWIIDTARAKGCNAYGAHRLMAATGESVG